LDNSKGNEKLLMFELQILKEDDDANCVHNQSEANQGYQFNLVYELNVGKSKMWKESL
jgi:hypothetical protein